MKKIFTLLLALVLCLFTLVGCAKAKYQLSYIDGYKDDGEYNESVFYENDLSLVAPDPSVICVTDPKDPYCGWFYMYPTGTNTKGYACYRSRDLNHWEFVSMAFTPSAESCGQTQFWAPECIYDKDTDKYYLFMTARDYYRDDTRVDADVAGYSYRNYDEKSKWMFYNDIISAEYVALPEAQKDGTPIAENISANAVTVEELKSAITARINAVTSAGADEEIPDGFEGGYTSSYAQVLIDAMVKRVEGLSYTGKNEDLIETLSDTLVYLYTPEIKRIWSQRCNQIILAVSDTPDGPFIQYTNEPGRVNEGTGEAYDADNRTITERLPFVGAEDLYHWIAETRSAFYPARFENESTKDVYGNTLYGQMLDGNGITLIDVHPFVDPESGKKYMYFDCTGTSGPEKTFLCAVEMGEKWTDDPKWETVTRLTRNGYYTVDSTAKNNKSSDLNEGSVNEGPHLIYNAEAKKYYLTMSLNITDSSQYSVIQAVGDSPMGPFRKLSKAEGGVLLASEYYWDHVAGPGHHCFISYGDRNYIVYHTHQDTIGGVGDRAIAADEIVWTTNADGLTVLHVNGPSAYLMPKIGFDAKYRNIAAEAAVEATNTDADSNEGYLNDGLIRIYSWDEWLNEFTTGSKKQTEITLTFDDYRTVRAIMIFNSMSYELIFEQIESIELDFKRPMKSGKTEEGTAVITGLTFDTEKYTFEFDEESFVRPGSSAIAEFEEMQVKEIRITLKHDKPIAISEIFVLGK